MDCNHYSKIYKYNTIFWEREFIYIIYLAMVIAQNIVDVFSIYGMYLHNIFLYTIRIYLCWNESIES